VSIEERAVASAHDGYGALKAHREGSQGRARSALPLDQLRIESRPNGPTEKTRRGGVCRPFRAGRCSFGFQGLRAALRLHWPLATFTARLRRAREAFAAIDVARGIRCDGARRSLRSTWHKAFNHKSVLRGVTHCA
jgi:hypothetical protein